MFGNRKEILSLYIGNKVKQRREELSLSQSEVSNKLDISRASISNIESGRHVIQINTLYDLAEILDVNVSYFLPNLDSLEFSQPTIFYSDIEFENSELNKNYINSLINNI